MKTPPQVGTLAFKRLLARSHEAQFNGVDFQTAAIDVATESGITYESDEYTELMTGPDPYCDCGFCATADWRDE